MEFLEPRHYVEARAVIQMRLNMTVVYKVLDSRIEFQKVLVTDYLGFNFKR